LYATPKEHPNRASRVTDQSSMLGRRFELTHSIEDLNSAIRSSSQAIMAVPPGHFQETAVLLYYAQLLANRVTVLGSFQNLDVAIDVCKRAVMITPEWHPDQANAKHTHSVLLHRRYAQTGTRQTLDAAIQMADIAAMSLSDSSPHRYFYRANLANLLQERFIETGSLEDLDRAVMLLDDAVDSVTQDDPNRLHCMNILGIALGKRFLKTGSMPDINKAIKISTRVLNSTSDDDPWYARHLANIGNSAGARYQRTGLLDDLNLAIDVLERATILPIHLLTNAAAFPHASVGPNSNKGGLWISLGIWLSERFKRTDAMEDLNRSIYVCEQAIARTPSGDGLHRAHYSYHLSRRLLLRFKRYRQEPDIVYALDAARIAVGGTPKEHTYRAEILCGLADALFERYNSWGAEDDIEEAISTRLQAIELETSAATLGTLGSYYGTRFQRTEKEEYLDDALLYFGSAVACTDSPPADRAGAAKYAAGILADREKWSEACSFMETVIDLLPHISSKMLHNSDKQHRLLSFSVMGSFAAAVSLQAGNGAVEALQLLEAGRGLIGASLLDLRSDISDLKREHPDIADRFEELRDQLSSRHETNSPQSNDFLFDKPTEGARLEEADEELTNLIAGIRDYPGFEKFLLPPSQHDLIRAASRGPVVVMNINEYRCDAFLIQGDRIWFIPLPNLMVADINDRLKETNRKKKLESIRSADTLKWLWEAAVEPILTELGYMKAQPTDNWPQVWWIPIGPLSWFPIHAAGTYSDGKFESTLDRVMSSYSSSVKSLIKGRCHSSQSSTRPVSERALLVAMPKTPGFSPLSCAEEEIAMLADLCPGLKLEAITPSERCRSQILDHLRGCKIFHFAGHGSVNLRDPAQSLLLLDDWQTHPLTVGNLRDLNLHGEEAPFLGLLSACSTGANEAIQLLDERIHIAGSLQLAGFRHVIGTLWEVNDSYCVEVARTVYETIRDEGMTDLTVCRALQKAVRKIREECRHMSGGHRNATLCDDEDVSEQPTLPTHWIPYLHFGV
jgi:tetratricopeptide (TPR) repeat protein